MSIEINQRSEEVQQNAINQDAVIRIEQEIRNQQSIIKGLIWGVIAGIIGAILWAVITVIVEYQIGWMAIGVGALVGFTVRKMGRGIDISFGIVGAVIALISCIVGNLLAICTYIGQSESMSIFQILPLLNFEIVSVLLVETFQPVDLLFYGLATVESYKLSRISIHQHVTENIDENRKQNDQENQNYIC